MSEALGILEVNGFTPALAAVDAMDKAGRIRILEAELNDFYGFVIKVTGEVASVRAAIDAGVAVATQMQAKPNSTIINRPDPSAMTAIKSKVEFNPLIQQNIVFLPNYESLGSLESSGMSDNPNYALGLIETQGFTAVFEAIDSACKAANVEVVGKEKLGGGYITVVLKGDVAAVKAAVDAGIGKITSLNLGKVIAGHVIARPSSAVMQLLPKV